MYLVITNDIVAPVESFTMLGLSTARGNADKIGQFGSGAKHAIVTLLRNGITPIISLGGRSLVFSTVDGQMGEKQYKKVVYRFDNGPQESTSMTLDFGSLDWTDVLMGLREFVSNAIDSCLTAPVIELKETVTVKAGQTVIAVPCTPDVMKFYAELPERFLQFSSRPNVNKRILFKEKAGKVKVYRKGVFVREVSVGMYDYNFGTETKIDESRNMADYTVVEHCSKCWREASVDELTNIFAQFSEVSDKVFEGLLSTYSLSPVTAKDKSTWREAYKKVYGDASIVPIDAKQLAGMAARKGMNYTLIPPGWYTALTHAGIKTLTTLLSSHGLDAEGRVIKQPSPELVKRVTCIWTKLRRRDLTRGKINMPGVMQFVSVMEAGSLQRGYYKDDVIYIAEGQESDYQTILEELAHYITGSTDNSRDFQDYAYLVASTFMMRGE